MKRLLIAAALAALFPAAALAQSATPATPATPAVPAPDVPKHKCGSAPELPGRMMMQQQGTQKLFEKEVQKYKDCIAAYVEERRVIMKANQDAANDAVNEYNVAVKKLQDEQAARRGNTDTGAAPPATKQ